MASITNPKAPIQGPTKPATSVAPAAKPPIKPPLTKAAPPKAAAPVSAPAKTAAPAQEKPAKVVKPKKEVVLDETTGFARNQPTSFRWVCLDSLKETWPESGKVEDYNEAAAVEACKRIYAERGGSKEWTDEMWAKQCLIIRAWLRSPQIAKPLPGDVATRAPMTDEQKQVLKDRLAAGRAKRGIAKKGPSASVDEQDAAAAVEEE